MTEEERDAFKHTLAERAEINIAGAWPAAVSVIGVEVAKNVRVVSNHI